MVTLEPDERAATILEPVEALLLRALSSLSDARPLVVKVASLPVGGPKRPQFCALRGDTLLLSDGLCGPALAHPDECLGPIPPMDRWRRACACVLEAACLRELSQRAALPPGDDWRWVGASIAIASRLAPELSLDLPDIALAVSEGSPGLYPRAGAAVMRAWRALGVDPVARVRELLDGSVVSSTEWLKIGAWIFASDGAIAALPVLVDRVGEETVPVKIPEWSWRMISIPASPKGTRLLVEGDCALEAAWSPGGTTLRSIAASASTSSTVREEPGCPLGLWEVASAEGFGQVMGARGIQFDFRADGRLEIVLADAFVGPLAAVAMADQVGTSGVCVGCWRIAGEYQLRFAEIETHSLTLHGRSRDRFLMPARGFGLGEWLLALNEDVWSWQAVEIRGQRAERLVMRGRMMGGGVEVRLKRVR